MPAVRDGIEGPFQGSPYVIPVITERDLSPAERAHYAYTQRLYAFIWVAIGLLTISSGAVSLHRATGSIDLRYGSAWIAFGVAYLAMAVVYYRRSSGAPPRGYRGV